MCVKKTSNSKSRTQNMITNFQSHLFVLTIAFIVLLLLPFVNCTNDPMNKAIIEEMIRTTTIKSHVYDSFKQENLNNDNEEKEFKQFIENFLENYPHRRASSFHAMRGKRSLKTA